jgi:signal transduction histidine kinase
MDHESWQTIGVVNRTGQLTLVSGRAPALLGLGVDTLAAHAFSDSLRTEDRPKFSSALAAAAQANGEAREVIVTLAGEGSTRTLACRLTALHDASAVASVLLDVQLQSVAEAAQGRALAYGHDERRQAEIALAASEARLRASQKIEAVGHLAGGVAHDFNNILLVIAGYTAAIARHLPPDHAAAAALHQITKAGERANALTKQLLALSRRQAIRPTRLDLGQILSEMHDMLARVMGRSILLSTRVAPNLATVMADRSQIEQLVLNLVLNAEDAMPGGGQLNIVAENVMLDEPEHVGKRACSGTASVALSVSDTGSGMDPETRARMFEPFFTTKARGTGLGLFMVQQIVRESGGTLSVVSQPGSGTRIIVELPACPEASTPAQADPSGLRARGALERPDSATAASARPA